MSLRIDELRPADWEAVRTIYQEGIETGQATFETQVPSWDGWDRTHLAVCRLVARQDGVVVGWAALSQVSERTVYRGVAETSVYVTASVRGQGVGKALLKALSRAAEAAGIWTLQASIFPENAASLGLYTSAGFREVGRRERIGRLRDVWRDTILVERRNAFDEPT